MSQYSNVCEALKRSPKTWLVTGAAGFIGSHLTQRLLELNQKVIGLDNLSTGRLSNLQTVCEAVGRSRYESGFTWIEGDVCDYNLLLATAANCDYVLHQAALGSVPRSIEDPIASNHANVNGFVSVISACVRAKVSRIVYASSSSVYGDINDDSKLEERRGKLLSPYAATKMANEIYAESFASAYGIECVGLRYFNVFGPRQDPHGAYAAVVPRWFDAMCRGETCTIFGDGETSRDFCFVANVVQANILAATSENINGSMVFNVAVNKRTSLKDLHLELAKALIAKGRVKSVAAPRFEAFRNGDIRQSLADVSLISKTIGYQPSHNLTEGLSELVEVGL